MKKGTLFLGVIATLFLFLFFGPDELLHYSLNSVFQSTYVDGSPNFAVIPGRPVASNTGDDIQIEATTDTSNPEISKSENYFPSFISDRSFFDDAYKMASQSNLDGFDKKVSSGILPHHLVYPEYIAEYFEKLSKTQDVGTFFVIGPNHYSIGNKSISVSEYGFSTPYGNIEPDTFKINKIFETKSTYVGFDIDAFQKEHSISSLVPFIKKSFPAAKIVAIDIKWGAGEIAINQLYSTLKKVIGPNDFLLGSVDFSHYMPVNVANFHDELAKSVIENFDFDGIKNTEIDSKPTLQIVMKYAFDLGSKDVRILHHTNSADKSMSDDEPETTSHFYIAFENGKSGDVDRSVSILALGDTMLGRFVRILSERSGNIEYPFNLIRGKEDRFFEGMDVRFANLEGPIYKQGVRSDSSMTFGFNEDTAPLLDKFGFDVLSVANNHALNQGNDGFDSTVQSLKNVGIGACGHPNDVSADSVVYKKYGGKSVAFLCFEDAIHPLDDKAAVELIKKVDKNVDFSIVSVHWGVEYKHSPNSRQQDLAHKFIDAGADFIIGHHPHVVEGFEIYNGVPVFYSLGNFIFDQYWSYDTQEQLGIGIVFGAKSYKIYLFPMKNAKSQPYLLLSGEKGKFFERFIGWGNYSSDIQSQIRSGVIEISR